MTKYFGKLLFLGDDDNAVVHLDDVDKYKVSKYSKTGTPHVSLDIRDGRTISNMQRKKAFATLHDIARFTGYTIFEAEDIMKAEYMVAQHRDYFSLSDTSVENASHFISFLLDFCFKMDVPFNTKTYDSFKTDFRFQRECVLHRRCIIDGQAHSDIHHMHAVGMGRNRGSQGVRKTNQSNRFTCLCRKHHTELHTSKPKFEQRYHIRIVPIQLSQDELKRLKVGY